MAANRFKSDESFLAKLAVGAAATKAVMTRLRTLGFDPVELERGSTGFKIWKKIKIKRIRVPDILCVRTGLRFESRGKTRLEISMSHSTSDPKRGWDAELRDDDYVAVVLCGKRDASPIDWEPLSPVHFIQVKEMRKAFVGKGVRITKAKGAEEGSEKRVVWPSIVSQRASVVDKVDSERIVLTPMAGGRRQSYNLTRRDGVNLISWHKEGDAVQANEIIAASVPVTLAPTRPSDVREGFYTECLKSASLSDRYAAAKAMRFLGYGEAAALIEERMRDPVEDIYVRLECAAALAAHKSAQGWKFLEASLDSDYLQVQLETVIVVSEIRSARSEQLLISVLTDEKRDDEVRAGAAWGLGQFPTRKSAAALIDTFNLASREIKVEAARALLRIAPEQVDSLVQDMVAADKTKRGGLAWTLARTGAFDPCTLLAAKPDDDLRRWASYIVGFGKDRFAEEQVSRLCKIDREVYFAATVLWQVLSSWVYGVEEY